MLIRTRARRIMQEIIKDEPQISSTQLAELTALELGMDHWLDNPEHWIWEFAAMTSYEDIDQ